MLQHADPPGAARAVGGGAFAGRVEDLLLAAGQLGGLFGGQPRRSAADLGHLGPLRRLVRFVLEPPGQVGADPLEHRAGDGARGGGLQLVGHRLDPPPGRGGPPRPLPPVARLGPLDETPLRQRAQVVAHRARRDARRHAALGGGHLLPVGQLLENGQPGGMGQRADRPRVGEDAMPLRGPRRLRTALRHRADST